MTSIAGFEEIQICTNQEPLTHMAPDGINSAGTNMATGIIGRPAQAISNSENARHSLNFKTEEDRLKTFTNWPVSFINKYSLAAAGFYYINRDDIVRCAFCDVEVGFWEEGDDPLKDHKRWSPNCPFLKGLAGNSMPVANRNKVFDECGMFGVEIRPHSHSENGPHEHLLEELGILKRKEANYPSFASIDIRMKSFDNWPKSMKQRPELLCEAGFFYTGQGDQVLCFHCGGGLKNWQPTDDPWVEHCKWYPKCTYVILNKGKEFVQKASTNLLVLSEDLQKMDIGEKVHEVSNMQSSSTEVQALPETSEKAQDESRLCKICFQEDLGVVFLPCGHFVSCVKCAAALTKCAVCRKPFTATVRAFLS